MVFIYLLDLFGKININNSQTAPYLTVSDIITHGYIILLWQDGIEVKAGRSYDMNS